MNPTHMHPAEQITQIMTRIYKKKMTTTSGGNLSIKDNEGNIWITPGSIDKGSLTAADICCMRPDGTLVGKNRHKPSIEAPIHALIYKMRPDLNAIVHAHPPALVAFSLARKIPGLRSTMLAHKNLNQAAQAAYAVPGSEQLGKNVAECFAKGFNLVMMDNHGAVVGGTDLISAFRAFEALEIAAETEMNANKIGKIRNLPEILKLTSAIMPMFDPIPPTPSEASARTELIYFVKRALQQELAKSIQGTFSTRLGTAGGGESTFLITPRGKDRHYLDETDIILIKGGTAERGKKTSSAVWLHKAIYDTNPNINAIIGASPPHAMAFAVTDAAFDSRTIPESYILLRDVARISWEQLHKPKEIAAKICEQTPVLLLENSQVLATGDSLLKAFDRLEVAEATAHSIIDMKSIGEIVHISEQEVKDIDMAFNLT